VVREERRMRVESDPQGKLMEQMLATAIEAHPYRNMPGGWASDIENLRVREAEKFFNTYYVPANITMGIVGDVDPARIRALADQYFSRLTKRPQPDAVLTIEPVQDGVKHVEVATPRSRWNLWLITGPISTTRTIRCSTFFRTCFRADAPVSSIPTWCGTRKCRWRGRAI